MTGSDIAGIAVTYAAALFLRFDFNVPPDARALFLQTLPLLILIYVSVFGLLRLYLAMWSYFSVGDLKRIALALGTSATVILATFSASGAWSASTCSILFLQFIFMGLWMVAGRLAVRHLRKRQDRKLSRGKVAERILIVGKPSQADILIRAGRSNRFGRFVGIVTDEPVKGALTLNGVPVCGAVDEVGEVARRTGANIILILPPFTGRREINAIIASCVFAKQACKYRFVPSLTDLASGQVTASAIRNVEIDDLLGREPVELDGKLIYDFIVGRKVMVTGAGGSIGSQICRQVARFNPSVLVLFDISELALFTIENELRELFPGLRIVARIGDIRYPGQIAGAIEGAGGIDVIYHAAAYKHVFLMERNVIAAFQTNVIGTANLARAAVEQGVERFVMISSDKAVRPSSIMGATKRIAERIIQELPPYHTKFVSVRFGNVLDSSGSVISIFRKQIAEGGPVTVTSENVVRYFMSIPEAVDLVLMAGATGNPGDIMVLDMGEPVRILDLAHRMIELSGFVPGEDIPIHFTGLRPGEKEYEEVMTDDENLVPSPIDRISVMRKCHLADLMGPVDLQKIAGLVAVNDFDGLRELAKSLIPEHQLSDSHANDSVCADLAVAH